MSTASASSSDRSLDAERRRAADLDGVYTLSTHHVAAFQEQGFIKVPGVLAPETIISVAAEIRAQVAALNQQDKPMGARSTYEKAFLQIMNLWRQNAVVRQLTYARKLARLAADLMGVDGVRLYHDQALFKEPAGGITPWHCDQQYWPFSDARCVTAWIPLHAVPLAMGPLAFSIGSQRCDFGRDLEISDESEHSISKALTLRDLPVDEGPFALGEVSFHAGWTFHRAGSNTSPRMREVMTVIYFADGMRLQAPRNRNQLNDWKTWMPGAAIGEAIATELNPLLWSRQEPTPSQTA
jgi:ectoine hydroxylase-related dioxygenase (phytanoyl-CoA dioxygenase family)